MSTSTVTTHNKESYAETLRLQKVRESSINTSALLDNRNTYQLSPVRSTVKTSGKTKKHSFLQQVRASTPTNLNAQDAPSSSPPPPESSPHPQFNDDITFSTAPNETNSNSNSNSMARTISKQNLNPHHMSEKLPPELVSYYTSLTPARLSEFRGRVIVKATSIASQIKSRSLENQKIMDTKKVFHPNANAQRAHTQMLVKLQNSLNDDVIENLVLRDMIIDDHRDINSDEVAKLEAKFGKLFQNTAFGGVLGVPDDNPSPRNVESLQSRFSNSNSNYDNNLPSISGGTIKNLHDRSVMGMDSFQRGGGGGEGLKNGLQNADAFQDFQNVRYSAARGKIRRGDNAPPLAYNAAGVYSGVHNENESGKTLIGKQVVEKLWHPSEVNGRKPTYRERTSTSRGFNNEFLDLGESNDVVVDDDVDVRKIEIIESREDENETETETDQDSDHNNNTNNNSPVPLRRNSTMRRKSLKQKQKALELQSNSDALHLQRKIETVWNILETPMIKRLQFLQKFSLPEICTKLPVAVALWEKASRLLPVRSAAIKVQVLLQKGRFGPMEITNAIDVGWLQEMGVYEPFPESFYFETRLEKGELTDEELIEVGKGFDDRVSGVEDDYMREMKVWVGRVVRVLSGLALKLQKEMVSAVGEALIVSPIKVTEK